LPRKNVLQIGGKPLIAWTIESAKASRCIDRLILSSDDDEIIQIAQNWGCEVPFVRSAHLASDKATTVDVVLDALQRCPGYDWIVVLQPTSPLRTASDIDSCLSKCLEMSFSAAISVCITSTSPYLSFHRDSSGQLQSLLPKPKYATRRQDFATLYQLNGSLYVANCSWLTASKTFVTSESYAYVMPKSRSIDIDDEFDFRVAELLLSHGY
jgi:N-acylneuraminate cytidylyltransferase